MGITLVNDVIAVTGESNADPYTIECYSHALRGGRMRDTWASRVFGASYPVTSETHRKQGISGASMLYVERRRRLDSLGEWRSSDEPPPSGAFMALAGFNVMANKGKTRTKKVGWAPRHCNPRPCPPIPVPIPLPEPVPAPLPAPGIWPLYPQPVPLVRLVDPKPVRGPTPVVGPQPVLDQGGSGFSFPMPAERERIIAVVGPIPGK